MTSLTELSKLIPQIPHTERVLVKKWIQRLQQPIYYPREQRINDKYVKILECQLINLINKKQNKLEYPLNLMPLDTVLTDIPDFICKKYQGQSINDTQFKKQQAKKEQDDAMQQSMQKSLVQQINEDKLEQIDQDITSLLTTVELPQHSQHTSPINYDKELIDIEKQLLTYSRPPVADSSQKTINREQIHHTRSKYSDISNSLTNSLIESQNKQLDDEIKKMQQIQEKILKEPEPEFELSHEDTNYPTMVHIKIPDVQANKEQGKSLGFIDSAALKSSNVKSKFFSQISNSFPVDYEQTPGQKDSEYSSPYIKCNSVYHNSNSEQIMSITSNKENRKKEIYRQLIEKQENNRNLFDSVQREVREAQVQYLEERLRVLELQLNDQDELIAQFFDCLE